MWINFIVPAAVVLGIAVNWRKDIKKSFTQIVRKNFLKQREAAENAVAYSKVERDLDVIGNKKRVTATAPRNVIQERKTGSFVQV